MIGRNTFQYFTPRQQAMKAHKDMRLDPTLELLKNGAQRQVVLQFLKGRFDCDWQDIKLPQLSWVTSQEVCAKQVSSSGWNRY
jgi:hypothetical protein